MAADKDGASFEPDGDVQKIAELYALDAVDSAKKQFGVTLDWSDESVAQVEAILSRIHTSCINTTPRPPEAMVVTFAKMYGSYVGEMLRRQHGCNWGVVSMNGEKFSGMRTTKNVYFWPWNRVKSRIIDGPENNVAHYYQRLLEK